MRVGAFIALVGPPIRSLPISVGWTLRDVATGETTVSLGALQDAGCWWCSVARSAISSAASQL